MNTEGSFLGMAFVGALGVSVLYYDKAYYKLDGHNVNSMGVTLGITLPIPRLYNGVSLGVDFGQRASTRYNMIRERYAMFVIGFNIHDLWFKKIQYH